MFTTFFTALGGGGGHESEAERKKCGKTLDFALYLDRLLVTIDPYNKKKKRKKNRFLGP